MRRSIAVFKYDRNPACDPPNFFITKFEAQDRVAKGYAHYIDFRSIQHHPPADWIRDERQMVISNLAKEAWRPKWSGDFIVLQLQKIDTRPG